MRSNTLRVRLTACVVTLVLLAGCQGLPPGYRADSDTPPGQYTVRAGDTLYSIAFRYGLDYKSVARLNGIGPPYLIYVDQVIRLSGSARPPQKDKAPTTSPGTSGNRTAASGKVTTRTMPEVSSAPVSAWRWPLKGKVIRDFSLSHPVNKGIDIAGSRGDRVQAAAGGVVVYAGGNLRGYGKLIIVKHNDNFLSAYGNNDRLLVSEGEKVKAGGAIAEVGVSAAGEPMVHFEIRRDGKPVNPLTYLP